MVKRVLKRAGNNPNIKGHINEIRMVNKLNFNPTNLIKGNKAQITKSPTAMRDDIIVKNEKNNRIIKGLRNLIAISDKNGYQSIVNGHR